ncbi:Pumilio homologue 3 like protein [Aduncisulcus paluster]|uniref:Pumilio homologue 3 like protein n=1 Tax=Aduncisulcus paluster TaxID=2918883 RepID=A0ABQ5KIB8_9EUKA|nr:Pumilio homologue 3 like protein [Aduncisulcus paluster]
MNIRTQGGARTKIETLKDRKSAEKEFLSIQGDLVGLAKDRYAIHVVRKIFTLLSTESYKKGVEILLSKDYHRLVGHRTASKLLDDLYKHAPNKGIQTALVEGLYGPKYAANLQFKSRSLPEVLKAYPGSAPSIASVLRRNVENIFGGKGIIMNRIALRAASELLSCYNDPAFSGDFCKTYHDKVIEFIDYDKEGMQLALWMVGLASAKTRQKICKLISRSKTATIEEDAPRTRIVDVIDLITDKYPVTVIAKLVQCTDDLKILKKCLFGSEDAPRTRIVDVIDLITDKYPVTVIAKLVQCTDDLKILKKCLFGSVDKKTEKLITSFLSNEKDNAWKKCFLQTPGTPLPLPPSLPAASEPSSSFITSNLETILMDREATFFLFSLLFPWLVYRFDTQKADMLSLSKFTWTEVLDRKREMKSIAGTDSDADADDALHPGVTKKDRFRKQCEMNDELLPSICSFVLSHSFYGCEDEGFLHIECQKLYGDLSAKESLADEMKRIVGKDWIKHMLYYSPMSACIILLCSCVCKEVRDRLCGILQEPAVTVTVRIADIKKKNKGKKGGRAPKPKTKTISVPWLFMSHVRTAIYDIVKAAQPHRSKTDTQIGSADEAILLEYRSALSQSLCSFLVSSILLPLVSADCSLEALSALVDGREGGLLRVCVDGCPMDYEDAMKIKDMLKDAVTALLERGRRGGKQCKNAGVMKKWYEPSQATTDEKDEVKEEEAALKIEKEEEEVKPETIVMKEEEELKEEVSVEEDMVDIEPIHSQSEDPSKRRVSARLSGAGYDPDLVQMSPRKRMRELKRRERERKSRLSSMMVTEHDEFDSESD